MGFQRLTRMFASLERSVLRRILESAGNPPVRIAMAGGPEVAPHSGELVAEIVISDWRTLAKLVLNPDINFGEAYADGRITISGDMVAFLEAIARSRAVRVGSGLYPWLAERWLNLTQVNSRRGSRHNIHHHYDISNEFYQLWLDPQLVYTCAYFPTPTSSLEDAQYAKLDHVCRKVRLQPGERVVEAGCGWGALALHMARQYGVKVKAFNISHEQIAYARWRAHHEGLENRVEFIEDDYRNIHGSFDVFVSVGMVEHVGRSNYLKLGKVIHRTIGDTGRGLLHFIGRNRPWPLSPWIRKHIFPGGYTPALREVMERFEPWNFAVVDVENLRLHYARTLEHWLDRFENSADEVSRMFDAKFVRTWRLYLAGSVAAFRSGNMQLFQVVFAGSQCQALPWTRAYLYQATREQDQQWTHATS